MSVEIRVSVEVGDSTTEDVYVRIQQRETVIAANDDVQDVVVLAGAALERMVTDVQGRSGEQLAQVARAVAEQAA